MISMRLYLRFSVQCDPNLDLFRVIGEERSANRAAPVLFARRHIAIGEELTFNYNLKYEEEVDDDDENTEIENVTSEKVRFLFVRVSGRSSLISTRTRLTLGSKWPH